MDLSFFAPRVSDDCAALYEGYKQEKLMLYRCPDCGRVFLPYAKFCPDCLGANSELIECEPRGTLYSFVVFRRAFHPSLEQQLPYITAVVTLDCGEKLVSNIVGCSSQELECGQRLKGVFCDDGAGGKLLRFALEG